MAAVKIPGTGGYDGYDQLFVGFKDASAVILNFHNVIDTIIFREGSFTVDVLPSAPNQEANKTLSRINEENANCVNHRFPCSTRSRGSKI